MSFSGALPDLSGVAARLVESVTLVTVASLPMPVDGSTVAGDVPAATPIPTTTPTATARAAVGAAEPTTRALTSEPPGGTPPGAPIASVGPGVKPESIEVAAALADPMPPIRADELPVVDEAPASFWDAIGDGTTKVRARYRVETVDDDAFQRDAIASTLRTALRYETPTYENYWGVIETEVVTVPGNDLFNSTTNGVTDRPVVADPETVEINESFIGYKGFEDVDLRLGRQTVNLDDQRFIGSVAWRQNFQTFDGLSVKYDHGRGDFFYAYFTNANRIFGDDSAVGNARMDTHLANFSLKGEAVKCAAYWYYLDVENLAAFSTSTVGASATGTTGLDGELKLLYDGEYARQVDIEDNPSEVDADYVFGSLGLGHRDLEIKLGYEVLSGSGDPGDKFSTPFSTLHKFNGWADKFLATPDAGLQDAHLSIGGKAAGGKWLVRYHDFSADAGGADFGTELDLLYTRKVSERLSWGVKYASYEADTFSTDSERAWAWLDVRF